MIERVIYTVVEQGRLAIQADPTLLDAVFQPDGAEYQVTDEELQLIKDWYAQRTPIVRHGYAIPGIQIPSWGITCQTEDVDKQALAAFVGMSEFGDSNTIGVLERRTYSLVSYAQSPDAAFWLYRIGKAIILRNLRVLRSMCAGNITWSGRELEPILNMAPEPIFMRALVLNLVTEEYIPDALPEAKVTGVTVRHVAAGGGVNPDW